MLAFVLGALAALPWHGVRAPGLCVPCVSPGRAGAPRARAVLNEVREAVLALLERWRPGLARERLFVGPAAHWGE